MQKILNLQVKVVTTDELKNAKDIKFACKKVVTTDELKKCKRY